MKKQISIIVVISLISIVFLSGCIGQQTSVSEETNGLVIMNLYTDPPMDNVIANSIGYEDNYIDIYFEIENVGSSKATDVSVELIGASWDATSPKQIIFNEINPPDLRTKSTGGIKPVHFRIRAPLQQQGQVVSHPLWIKVTYNYGTAGTAIIQGFSESRYLNDLEQGKISEPQTTSIEVQKSELPSPIDISITGPDKIIVPDINREEFIYQVTISNIGDGTPISGGINGLVYGGLWITGPGAYFSDCMGISAGSPYLWQYASQNGVVSLNNMIDQYTIAYGDDNWNIVIREDDGEWSGAVQYTDEGISVGIAQNLIDYPTILDWEFMGDAIPPVKLQRSESVKRPCVIAIDNLPGGWANRQSEVVTLNFDLRYQYYFQRPFEITATSRVFKG